MPPRADGDVERSGAPARRGPGGYGSLVRGDVAGRERTVRVRRAGSGLLLVAALVNLGSALTPPVRERLQALAESAGYPLALHEAATAFTAVTGIVLLQLARGVRRGQRWAWAAALALLSLSAAGHILKGLDVEEAALSVGAVIFLVVTRRNFRAPTNRESVRLGVSTLLGAGVVAVVAATIGVQMSNHRMAWARAGAAVGERLVGDSSINIGGRLDATLTIALAAVGIGLAVSLGWLLVRPVLTGEPGSAISLDAARDVVARHGGDTLSYFALRDDKHHLRVGDTLIAYAVRNGVCLVSPDPIGPADERAEAWSAFRDHATRQGWNVAVLAASEQWLPIYGASGMSHRYIGDEAVVDTEVFSLSGGAMKGLRQAVNRIANYGYTIGFYDPAAVDPTLADQLRTLMRESRQGQVERGFSMTLSRLFDPRDAGLLLAVCFGPDGVPVAFCQFVPASDIGGYSLDLMRRSEGDHPNGLTDFVIVRTIEHLRANGQRGLSLNFAAMRAVLAGEMGQTVGRRMEKRVVERLSESMQIESLWRYNAKFQPTWHRRYLAYDSPENLMAVGLAVASAEQFWELPVIGRFLPAPPPPAALVSA
jgi:lysylphosphatidylglycerol synthetase-like protein (DUF2156 family)